jgi:hypothetical protein
MTAVIRPAIVKMIKAGQKAKRLTDYICGKAITTRADMGFGTVKIDRDQLPWVNETLRAYHKNKRASEVRHVVFAVPKGTPRKEAIELLLKLSLDWIDEYAPGRHWLLGIHDDNGFYHGHLAVANSGEDGKAIQIDQFDVKNMAALKFTSHAVSAKGTGMNTGLPVYSKAAKLDVRDLAVSLVDDAGTIRNNRWDELVATGKITDIHLHARTGTPTSFQYEGRFVGFKALHQFIAHEQTKKQLALDEASVPAPPEPLAALLARVAKTAASPPPPPALPPLPPAAPPLLQPESPLDQFVRIGQQVRPAQNQTKPGVTTPGTNLK